MTKYDQYKTSHLQLQKLLEVLNSDHIRVATVRLSDDEYRIKKDAAFGITINKLITRYE